MTFRARGLTALAVGLASGLVVLGLATLRLRGGVPDAQGRGERVLELAPDRVRAIELQAAGGAIRLAREGAGWRVETQRTGPIEGRVVEALLRDLAALTRRATLSGPTSDRVTLSPYGLDAPRVRLALAEESGRVERLALGGDTGEDGAAFVQVTSGEVVVISTSAAAALDADLAAIRAAIPDAATQGPRAGEPAPAPVPARTGG